MKQRYNLVLVLMADRDYQDEQENKTLVQNLVGNDVSIVELSLLGKKHFAYPIKKHTDGVYLSVSLEGARLRNADLEKKMHVTDTPILRYLLTLAG